MFKLWLISFRSALSPARFQTLADVPPDLEWLGNIEPPGLTRTTVAEFSRFAGLTSSVEQRTITRAHAMLGARTRKRHRTSIQDNVPYFNPKRRGKRSKQVSVFTDG